MNLAKSNSKNLNYNKGLISNNQVKNVISPTKKYRFVNSRCNSLVNSSILSNNKSQITQNKFNPIEFRNKKNSINFSVINQINNKEHCYDFEYYDLIRINNITKKDISIGNCFNNKTYLNLNKSVKLNTVFNFLDINAITKDKIIYTGHPPQKLINIKEHDLRKLMVSQPGEKMSQHIGKIQNSKASVSEISIFDYSKSKFEKFNKIKNSSDQNKFYNKIQGYHNYFRLKEKYLQRRMSFS